MYLRFSLPQVRIGSEEVVEEKRGEGVKRRMTVEERECD